MPDHPRVTLAMIAAEAGVSKATVSKVLNGRPDVSAGTRTRLEALLRHHGYRRRPATSPSRTIEMVFSELDAGWSLEVIRGVERAAQEAGFAVILTVSGDRHSPADDWLEGVLQRRPAGVVLVFADLSAAHREKLRAQGMPFAIVAPSGDPAPGVPSVGSANRDGAFAATRHLIELGHRRIAAITGPRDMMCSVARLEGYRDAMAAARLPVDPDWVRFGTFLPAGGEGHARELLARPDRPTAVFAGSDLQALGVIAAATATGLTVPTDLSVVGYDDIALSRWMSPQLTTVHQPLALMGAEAARTVLHLAGGGVADSRRINLPTRLIVRDSSAPAAA